MPAILRAAPYGHWSWQAPVASNYFLGWRIRFRQNNELGLRSHVDAASAVARQYKASVLHGHRLRDRKLLVIPPVAPLLKTAGWISLGSGLPNRQHPRRAKLDSSDSVDPSISRRIGALLLRWFLHRKFTHVNLLGFCGAAHGLW